MTTDGDATPDRDTVEALRQAIDGEAQAAPPPDDVWARMRRRLGRRRAARVGGVTAVSAALVVAAGVAGAAVWQSPWQSDEPAASEVVFGEPDVPAGWQTVTVGGADVSVPPEWDIVDARPDRTSEEPCPAGSGRTLWVRGSVGNADPWLPTHCEPGPGTRAVQVSELTEHMSFGNPLAGLEGTTTRLGAVAAWRATLEADDSDLIHMPETGPGRMRTWLAPAVDLSVHVPEGLDATDVLATVRPHGQADPDHVALTIAAPGVGVSPGEPAAAYIAITAQGRRHVWFTRPRDPEASRPDYRFRRWSWPGLSADRFAVLEGNDTVGVRVMAGRPSGGQILYRQPAAARGLTDDSYPQVAWSPDGTALAWYAPRAEPVMGVVQWADVAAIADGQEPVHEQTVRVAHGPVHIDSPAMSWERRDGDWVLGLQRGQPPPWDPDAPLRQRQRYDWRLPLGRDADGVIALPDPVSWERVGGSQ